MIRSPTIVWLRISSISASSSGPGLWRISSGIATLPTSWSSAARRTTSIPSASIPSSIAVIAAVSATLWR